VITETRAFVALCNATRSHNSHRRVVPSNENDPFTISINNYLLLLLSLVPTKAKTTGFTCQSPTLFVHSYKINPYKWHLAFCFYIVTKSTLINAIIANA